jgi:hypothetical protein
LLCLRRAAPFPSRNPGIPHDTRAFASAVCIYSTIQNT